MGTDLKKGSSMEGPSLPVGWVRRERKMEGNLEVWESGKVGGRLWGRRRRRRIKSQKILIGFQCNGQEGKPRDEMRQAGRKERQELTDLLEAAGFGLEGALPRRN
jgi:hypothetical protein